jgi:hypothetical protein
MICREFFEQHQDNDDKCKLLRSKTEAELTRWESESASEYSQNVVTDDEILARQIVSPIHVSDDGLKLNPDAFNECATHGLSVNRENYATREELKAAGTQRVAKYNRENPDKLRRELVGFTLFHAGEVRSQRYNGARCFFVYDTALPPALNENSQKKTSTPKIGEFSRLQALWAAMKEFACFVWSKLVMQFRQPVIQSTAFETSHADICLGGNGVAKEFRRARSKLYDLAKDKPLIRFGSPRASAAKCD